MKQPNSAGFSEVDHTTPAIGQTVADSSVAGGAGFGLGEELQLEGRDGRVLHISEPHMESLEVGFSLIPVHIARHPHEPSLDPEAVSGLELEMMVASRGITLVSDPHNQLFPHLLKGV